MGFPALTPPEPDSVSFRWRLPTALLVALVLLELVLSAAQHYQLPLDGDLAPIVVPAAHYQRVLTDPFGFGALRGDVYAAPNRYFAHLAMVGWVRYVPLALQRLGLAPITSVYAAAALFKTLVQAALLVLLAGYASGTLNPRRRDFWVAGALLAPLFQTVGYQVQMGLIDRSVTYTFFYALPLAGLLGLLWPFYRAARRGERVQLSVPVTAGMLALALVLCLSGTIVTGVVSVLLPGIALAWVAPRWRAVTGEVGGVDGVDGVDGVGGRASAVLRQLPTPAALVLGGLGVLALYSLWIGRQNIENLTNPLPLATRYARLIEGVAHLFTAKLGLPLLVAGALLNLGLIRRFTPTDPAGQRWRRAGGWLLGFTLAYLLLLPLGGYRPYRALVVRYDTILPLTLGLLGFYAGTARYLLRHLPAPTPRRAYATGLALVALIFVIADRRLTLRPTESNGAEHAALTQLAAAAPGTVVRLPPGARVLAWGPITDPRTSAVNAALLTHWRVTARPILYYSAPDSAPDSAPGSAPGASPDIAPDPSGR